MFRGFLDEWHWNILVYIVVLINFTEFMVLYYILTNGLTEDRKIIHL